VLDAMRDMENCQRKGGSWLFALSAKNQEPHLSYFPSPSLNMYLIEGL